MYAIIESGGKQLRVEPRGTVLLERLPLEEGDAFETDKILLAVSEAGTKVGTPYVAGAKVCGVVLGQVRGPKVRIVKFKPKKNYRRQAGHRQNYTRVRIQAIEV